MNSHESELYAAPDQRTANLWSVPPADKAHTHSFGQWKNE